MVGRAVVRSLEQAGHEAVHFDLLDGHDVLDAEAVVRQAAGCDAIIHLAAVDDPAEPVVPAEFSSGTPEQVLAVTVLGTWNVLEAARSAGHSRVVIMSSVDALGIFLGQRPPDYLPIDNQHPTYPTAPYALAKRTAERMCRMFTERTGIATICLRPPGVWTAGTFAFIRRRWAESPLNDRLPFWEYGAFIAAEDLAEAVTCAVRCPVEGHATLLISSDDAALAEQTSREAARSIHPSVPWRGGPEFDRDPYRTLVDNEPAKSLLGWSPVVRFRPRA
jgi:UDP-glucose 4-epimerase